MSINTVKFFASKYNLDNDKGHQSIVMALNNLAPSLNSIYIRYSHEMIWKELSTSEINENQWVRIFEVAAKYYNNYVFL